MPRTKATGIDQHSLVVIDGDEVNKALKTPASTISILILDSSSSMDKYGETPQTCVNEHLAKIKNPPDGRAQFCIVFTFDDQYRIVVPFGLAKDIKPMTSYRANGNTLLWKTVYKVISLFLGLQENYKADHPGADNLKVFVGVFTDGEDNQSMPPIQQKDYQAKLQTIAQLASQSGWELFTFGIGINAQKIAFEMGFPIDDAHAVTVTATHAGIHRSSGIFTRYTTGFAGQNFDKGSPQGGNP